MSFLTKNRWAVIAVVCVLGMFGPMPISAQGSSDEYEVKAILISKLFDFVHWPESIQMRKIEFCIVGENPFGESLDAVFSNRQDVNIRYKANAADDYFMCDAIFLSQSETRHQDSLLVTIESEPILTISDIQSFAVNRGMINLTYINRRVRFIINKEKVDSVGLQLDFQLLSLADIVTSR
ncbi:MAG: DUF4154 domain-containing protein [Pseudomonadales bacterium]|nr:DUF4154 domain-containing protein [Pseudomonadales bacterium]